MIGSLLLPQGDIGYALGAETTRLDVIDIGVINVRDSDDQYPHFADRPVDDPRRDVDHRPRPHFLLLPVQHDFALARQDVVQLSRNLMVVGFGSIDVDRMCPSRDIGIPFAEEAITVTAGTSFFSGFVFVAEDEVYGLVRHIFEKALKS